MRRRFVNLLFIALLAIAPLAAAQSETAYPLIALTVIGNKHFRPAQIIAASGLKTGQLVRKADFDAARRRLLETGAFESVGYEYKPSAAKNGYDASFDVVEVALMYPYRFEDLPAPDAALREILRKHEPLLGDEIPATREVLGRYERTLTEFLAGKVQVQGRLSNEFPGEPAIVFRPAGERPRISEVHFTGNDTLGTKDLTMKFADVAVGAEFSEASVRRILDASIRPLYEARGRIRVAFPKIVAEPSKEAGVNGVSVTVAIDEGPAYTLGAVHFAGVDAKQSKEFEALASFHQGETANFDEIQAGINKIAKRYKSNGYLHAFVRVERTIHDQERTVDLTITPEAGPRYSFGKLAIEGLDLIGEPAVRKLWGERAGKPFDPDFPDAFLKQIRDAAMFDNLGEASAETKIDEASRTVDVTLLFRGAKPQDANRRRLGQP
jgi:outer membrane protein insertion porin family